MDPLVLLVQKNKVMKQFRKLFDGGIQLKTGYHICCKICAATGSSSNVLCSIMSKSDKTTCSCRLAKAIKPDEKFVASKDLIYLEADQLTGCSPRGEEISMFCGGSEVAVVEPHHCDSCNTLIGTKYKRILRHDGYHFGFRMSTQEIFSRPGPVAPYFMVPRSNLMLVEVIFPLLPEILLPEIEQEGDDVLEGAGAGL